jgi:hypothetical protein
MKHTFPLSLFLFITIISLNLSCQNADYFLRFNQAGYLPGDIKPGIIISESNQEFNNFYIIDRNNSKIIYTGKIEETGYEYDKFSHCYTFDFSGLNKPGLYAVEINGKKSGSFQINDYLYNNIVDSLMLFFKVQRCGPTNPFLHEKCHLSDATKKIGVPDTNSVDVTGGWHDAGDYIKFFSTTAATTYLLLFSYNFDKARFGFDADENGVPDILEEAKIGLDWLLRCNYSDSLFVVQVQDESDHTIGWRLPENDSLQFDRPAYVGIGKNLIGIYSAVMAMASSIWNEDLSYPEFADTCLKTSVQKYSIHKKQKGIENGQSVFYNDNNYLGKLALGAIELYYATKDKKYLHDAIVYGDSADSDYWWSWGDINSLAHFRISETIPRFIQYISNNLSVFNTTKNKSVFNESTNFTWGTTTTFLGAALQAILYKSSTGINRYDSLLYLQREYIFGRNPWGISFISNVGEFYPKHIHSQVAYFNRGYLPGALTAGPASEDILEQFEIIREDAAYNYFNSDEAKYFDDRNDYITNEPTIFSNATALFVLGYFSKPE